MTAGHRTFHKSEEELPPFTGNTKGRRAILKEKPVIALDARTLTADYLIRNIDEALAVWDRPWNRHLSFNEFCEWILPYRVSGEVPEEWRTLYRERFLNLFCQVGHNTDSQAGLYGYQQRTD